MCIIHSFILMFILGSVNLKKGHSTSKRLRFIGFLFYKKTPQITLRSLINIHFIFLNRFLANQESLLLQRMSHRYQYHRHRGHALKLQRPFQDELTYDF